MTASPLIEKVRALSPRTDAALLFAGSFGLRWLYRVGGLFCHDSVVLARAVEQSFETHTLQGEIDGRYGGVFVNLVVYVPWRLLSGTPGAESSVVFTNIVVGSAAVACFYLLLREILARRVAALSAAILWSVSPIYFSITTQGKPHGIEAFFVLLGLLGAVRFHAGGGRGPLVLGSAAAGFAVICREAALVYLPVFALAVLRPRVALRRPFLALDRRRLAPGTLMAAFGPVLSIVAIAFVAYLDEVVAKTLFRPGPATASFLGPFSSVLPLAASDLLVDLSWLGALLAATGVALTLRSPDAFPALLLLVWAALFLYAGNNVAYSPRYLAVITAAFFAFIGVSVAAVADLRPRAGWLAALLVSGLALHLFLRIEPVVRYRTEHVGGKDQAFWLRERVPPDSVLIVMDDAPFFEYYAGFQTLQHPVLRPVATEHWLNKLAHLVRSGTPVYINSSGLAYDPDGRFQRALRARFELVPADQCLTEDYHRTELRLQLYVSKLYRLRLRAK